MKFEVARPKFIPIAQWGYSPQWIGLDKPDPWPESVCIFRSDPAISSALDQKPITIMVNLQLNVLQ